MSEPTNADVEAMARALCDAEPGHQFDAEHPTWQQRYREQAERLLTHLAASGTTIRWGDE